MWDNKLGGGNLGGIGMQRGDTGGKRREERCTGVHACVACAVYYPDVLFALRWGLERES